VQGARIDTFLDGNFQRPLLGLCILSAETERMGLRGLSANQKQEESNIKPRLCTRITGPSSVGFADSFPARGKPCRPCGFGKFSKGLFQKIGEIQEMQISNSDRAKILVQALPYIQTHAGRTIVVKYGGSAMVDDALKDAVMSDIVLMQLVGIRVVVVHGGGKEISAMLEKIGKKSRFVDGLRYTDRETIDVVQMVLAGKVNKDLVQLLERHSGRAVGLCGLDDGLLTAEKMTASEDLGYVGEITRVNPAPIDNATQNGYVPVVAPVAGGADGEVYNINADIAAARIAAELKAEKLILMTDVRGLLRDKDDESTLIPRRERERGAEARERGHHHRRHDSENPVLRGRRPARRRTRTHHRRANPALDPDRAVFRRRHRYDVLLKNRKGDCYDV
jgi:acetylglutamate kinase